MTTALHHAHVFVRRLVSAPMRAPIERGGGRRASVREGPQGEHPTEDRVALPLNE